jgi:dephospho-CoA kinase
VRTIGLTGPIGCGKSTVAGWLSDAGASVIDADVVAREVTEQSTAVSKGILDRFGPSIARPDGSLDRAALGRLVFGDPVALSDLEAIVHPAVRQWILARLSANEKDGAELTVIEAIKLVEGGLAAWCDEVWLVTCDPDVQRERLVKRSPSVDETDQRIAAQAGIVERLRPSATRVIDTSASRASTRKAVIAALEAVRAASRLRDEG